MNINNNIINIMDFNTALTQEHFIEVEPNLDDLHTYLDVVFSWCEGYIPLRGFMDGGSGQGKPHNVWVHTDAGCEPIINFLHWADRAHSACYLIPGVVAQSGQAKANEIIQCQTILIDIDNGDINQKMLHLQEHLGTPTLIVESGGRTSLGQPKLHLYWKLTEAVEGENLQLIARARHSIATKAGGDIHFQSLHQPIRIPGSVYRRRNQVRLVSIRNHNHVEYELGEFLEKVNAMPPLAGVGQEFDFNNVSVIQDIPLNKIETTPVHEGGVDEWTRFEGVSRIIGYWIRRAWEGKITLDHAWAEIQSYNTACLRPSWDEQRLRTEVDRLWKKHIANNGQPKPVETARKINLLEWNATKFVNPKEKKYLIEGILPLGDVCLLAAMGGVGKGMLTLDLALKVAYGQPDLVSPPESLGGVVKEHGVAVIFAAEDTHDELTRRIDSIDTGNCRLAIPNNLLIIPLPNCGGPMPIITMSPKGPEATIIFSDIRKQLLDLNDLKMVVFDPLASFIMADITKRPEIGTYAMGLFASLAEETKSTIILCHHMRKPPQGKGITTPIEAREAIRGSTSLVDGVRCVYALWPAEDSYANNVCEKLNLKWQRDMVYQGTVVKSNMPVQRDIKTFVRRDNGLLVDATKPYRALKVPDEDLETILVTLIAEAAAKGVPYTKTGNEGVYQRRHELPKSLNILGEKKLRYLIDSLLEQKRIFKCRRGNYTVRNILDVEGGQFYQGMGFLAQGGK